MSSRLLTTLSGFLTVLSFIISGYANAGRPTGPSASPVTAAPAGSSTTGSKSDIAALIFFDSDESHDEITKPAPQPNDPNEKVWASLASDQEWQQLIASDTTNKLYLTCGWQPPAPVKPGAPQPRVAAALLLPLANWLIGQAVSLAVNTVDSALQKQVALYTHQWTATDAPNMDSEDLYKILSNGAAEGMDPDKNQTACFRYTRLEPVDPKDPKTAFELAADFIGVVSYDAHNPYFIKFAPLRLYYRSYSTIAAETSDGTVAVKISLAADDIFLSSGQVQSKTNAVNGEILAANIKQSDWLGKPIYLLYDPTKLAGLSSLLPPSDTNSANKMVRNDLETTITLTEIGNQPWLLKNAANLFHSNAKDITSTLTTDAENYVKGLVSPASTPK